MDALETVKRLAREERMFRRVSSVIVAVSGGPDSLAALLLMLKLKDEFGFEVAAAHFDHQLRPTSADDLQHVRDVCKGLGVRCLSGEGDVADAAAKTGESVEMTARKARYEFLAFAAGKERAEAVVTGHTFDDQAETVLQRVVRGSGIRGIRGMLPVATVPGAQAIALVRPLLSTRREQTVEICREAGVEPIQDSSNEDRSFQRNRIRHESLPELRKLNPSVDAALVRIAQHARESFAPVERQANMVQPSSRGPDGSVFELEQLQSLPAEAQTLVIEREASFHKTDLLVNQTLLHNLADVAGSGTGSVTFGSTAIEASAGFVRIGKELPQVEDVPETVLTVPGVALAGGWRVTVATDRLPAVDGSLDAAVAMSAAGSVLRIRSLRSGDRLRRADGDRRISSLLSNAKVPVWQRRRMLAVATKESVVALLGAPEGLLAPVPEDEGLFIQAAPLNSE